MRAKERIEKGVKPTQLVLTEDEHRRLKVHVAMNDMTIGEFVKWRLQDVIDPMGLGPARPPKNKHGQILDR